MRGWMVGVGVLLLGSVAGAQVPRGYTGRASGFDLNADGVPDAAVCDGGATNEDVDGNGVADRQVYVDCGTGSNATGCGTTAAPCGTIQFALNSLPSPQASQIQAVCFRGTCANATVSFPQSGAVGTTTRPQSGSEDRPFQYPRYPLLLSGWDTDGDNVYPPLDTNDVAVLDGNVSGNTSTALFGNGANRIEVAHFTVRDYGRTCSGDSGIMNVGLNAGTVNHLYVHDLVGLDNNFRCSGDAQSGRVLFNMFSNVNRHTYLAFEHLNLTGWGGFGWRGGSPAANAGPVRIQNVTAIANTLDSSTVVKIWGAWTGIEILDVHFKNTGSYSGESFGVHVAQCNQDVTIRNSDILDWQDGGVSIQCSDVAGGQPTCAQGTFRSIEDVVVDVNDVRLDTTAPGFFGNTPGIRIEPGGSNSIGCGTVDITNNAVASVDPDTRVLIGSDKSVSSGTNAGIVTIAGNILQSAVAGLDLGAIAICNIAGCQGVRAQSYRIQGNQFLLASGRTFVNVAGYAPSDYQSDTNVYGTVSGSGNWVWNGMTQGSLAQWRTALGGCPGTGNDCASTEGGTPPPTTTTSTTAPSSTLPPTTSTSTAPVPSTTSTSRTTTTSSTSTTATTPPGSVVACGNPSAGVPPRFARWWGGTRTASQGCVAPAQATVDGVRLYLGTLGSSFSLRVALYRQEASGSLTRLCESAALTQATANAWLTVPLSGCGTVAAGTALLPAWIANTDTTEVGEWDDCEEPYGGPGTNRWQDGGSPAQSFPATWNPTAPDGCVSAIGVLLRTAGPVPSTTSTTATTSSTSTSSSSTSTSTSSTTTVTYMCPSPVPCP